MDVLKFKYSLIFLIIPIILCFGSCKPSAVNSKQMEAYIEKSGNGLIKSNNEKQVKVSVNFRPSDLLVEQELKAFPYTTLKTIDSLRNIYQKNLYFVLHMSYKEQEVLTGLVGESNKFSEMVEKLSFEMNNYISLTTDIGDTLQLLDFVYPRMYGMSGGTDIMFVFENKIHSGIEELHFNLNECGLNIGKMQFPFKVRDIYSIPRLTFSTNTINTNIKKNKR